MSANLILVEYSKFISLYISADHLFGYHMACDMKHDLNIVDKLGKSTGAFVTLE